MKKLLTIIFIISYSCMAAGEWVQVNNWAIPLKVNTNNLEEKLWQYINQNSKHDFEPKDSYIYQYKTISNQELYINAVCKNRFNSDLTQEFLVVLDGGSCYFQAIYNFNINAFVRFEVNGES